MNTLRNFIRQFPRFKRQAEEGKTVRLVDRRGRRFQFIAEKPARCQGAAKHMSTGQPLSPNPMARDEWEFRRPRA